MCTSTKRDISTTANIHTNFTVEATLSYASPRVRALRIHHQALMCQPNKKRNDESAKFSINSRAGFATGTYCMNKIALVINNVRTFVIN